MKLSKPKDDPPPLHLSDNASSRDVNYHTGMTEIEFTEMVCDNFMLVAEVTGLTKQAFAKSVGLTSQQMSNIKVYRNRPPEFAIAQACEIYGLTTDFFYRNELGGMRDEKMADKLRKARAA